MDTHEWQKSSYCQEGEACLHVAVSGVAETVHLTESGDPAHSILSATPAASAPFSERSRETHEQSRHRIRHVRRTGSVIPPGHASAAMSHPARPAPAW